MRKFKVGDKVLLLLPTDSNKLLLQWKDPFEVLNRMDYVDGVIGTYHANILKQYVERRSVTSHCLFSNETVTNVDEVHETDEYSLHFCQNSERNRLRTSVIQIIYRQSRFARLNHQ